ncbi:hypothetical protein EDB89DRAFT_1902442 [Lactarius sanguifluus]|nr:hypothetical protein EDB89DRAFT_1902442 [Lactarius sanguifluus]
MSLQIVAGSTGPISVPLYVLWQLSFSLFSWVDGLPRYFLEQNAAGREDEIEEISEWAWWVRKYCFAVTKYLHALMDPYRIDERGHIRSHHSLEYSRQTGNTIMEHGRAVISGPWAHPPSVLEIDINEWNYFSPGVTSCGILLNGGAPFLREFYWRWSSDPRVHIWGYRSRFCAITAHVAIDYFSPYQRELNTRYDDVHTHGPGHIPANNLEARSWGMDQFGDQGPPVAGPDVILPDARRDSAEAPLHLLPFFDHLLSLHCQENRHRHVPGYRSIL